MPLWTAHQEREKRHEPGHGAGCHTEHGKDREQPAGERLVLSLSLRLQGIRMDKL